MPQVRRKAPVSTAKPKTKSKKKRGKIDKRTGERILLVSHISRSVHIKWYIISFLLLLLFALLYFNIFNIPPIDITIFDFLNLLNEPELISISYSPFLFILPVLSLIIIFIQEIKIHIILEKYIFTEKRMIVKMDFLKRVETSLEYEMISHYKLKQGVLKRFFDTGTIEIQSVAGTASPEMMITDAAGISKIKKLIAKQVIKTKGVFS